MVALLDVLARRRGPTVVVECRHCGTTIDGSPATCPTCGDSGFARYEIQR